MEELDRKFQGVEFDSEERSYEPYDKRPDTLLNYGLRCSPAFDYIVNLDEEIFAIGPGAFFSLRNIPRGESGDLWQRFLTYDYSGITVQPDFPRDHPRFPQDNVPPPIHLDNGLASYRKFQGTVKFIDSSSWMPREDHEIRSPSRALSSAITKALLFSHFTSFREARRSAVMSERFRFKAEILIRAASPSGFSLRESWRVYNPYTYSPDKMLPFGHVFWGQRMFRYRGCVIFLTQGCSSDEYLQAHVGLAIRHARDTGKDRCTFIIFSIAHVAVAVISGALSDQPEVSHSKLYSFLETFGSDEFEEAFGLLTHYLRPHCIDGGAILRTAGEGVQGAILPWDILQRIMQAVDDETYDKFRLVCKGLRRDWFLHPRVDGFTVNSVGNSSYRTFKHIPRFILHVTDRDGCETTLCLFGQVPCGYTHHELGCRCEPCCPCSNLCEGKVCHCKVELRLPPLAEVEADIVNLSDPDKWLRKSRRECRALLEDGKVFRTDLRLVDLCRSREYCCGDYTESSCSEPTPADCGDADE